MKQTFPLSIVLNSLIFVEIHVHCCQVGAATRDARELHRASPSATQVLVSAVCCLLPAFCCLLSGVCFLLSSCVLEFGPCFYCAMENFPPSHPKRQSAIDYLLSPVHCLRFLFALFSILSGGSSLQDGASESVLDCGHNFCEPHAHFRHLR
jgi:hypothetical protein